MNQKLVVDNELFMESGHTNIKMKIIHNNRELAQKSIDAVYRALTDASIAMDLKSTAVNGGFKIFSKKPAKSAVTEIGMEVNAMGKTVLLLNKYEPGKIGSSILVNGKALPVSTQLSYALGASVSQTSFAVNMGTYTLKTSANIFHKGNF